MKNIFGQKKELLTKYVCCCSHSANALNTNSNFHRNSEGFVRNLLLKIKFTFL